MAVKKTSKASEIVNSFTNFATSIANFGTGAQLSKTDTLYYNLRYNLVSNDRSLLSQLYVEHGLIQTMIDQPVDDAFSTGFKIKTGQLDADDIERLERFIEAENVIKKVMDTARWARLFGGGALMIMTDQKPDTPLDASDITEDSNLEFRAVDMWELYNQGMNSPKNAGDEFAMTEYFQYYDERVHRSRLIIMKGKEAPSFVRQRLRGWGMSEIERVVRSISQYFKNQDVIFDLMDEAKVDVYKINGFNASMLTAGGTSAVSKRIELSNTVKGYLNALVMDTKDDYIQKQMQFTGLAEVFTQIRMQVASDLKMPMTKLFGISSAGFSSGEDDIENYNTMVNSEVRQKVKPLLVDAISICCQKLFSIQPEDLTIEWESLRQLTSEEEENVKNSKFNRNMSAYQSGAIRREVWAEGINKDGLLPVEIDEDEDANIPLEGQFIVGSSDSIDKQQ